MLASLSCLTLKQDRYVSSTSYEAFTQAILDTILAASLAEILAVLGRFQITCIH